MALSPLANRFIALAANDSRPSWTATADLIKRAGRFVLAPEVVKLTLKAPEPAELLPAIVHGIRLPHDPCWIEYSPEQFSSVMAVVEVAPALVRLGRDRRGSPRATC